MTSGYTVASAVDCACDCTTELAKPNAGGIVVELAVKQYVIR